MNRQTIISFLMVLPLILCFCSSQPKVDGWYLIADSPDNSIVGKPLAIVKDFEKMVIVRDTFINDYDTIIQFVIQGRVNYEKRRQWAEATERIIGKRLGFLYNDSVVTAPQINARIESGAFQINSPDTTLIKTIYNSITTLYP